MTSPRVPAPIGINFVGVCWTASCLELAADRAPLRRRLPRRRPTRRSSSTSTRAARSRLAGRRPASRHARPRRRAATSSSPRAGVRGPRGSGSRRCCRCSTPSSTRSPLPVVAAGGIVTARGVAAALAAGAAAVRAGTRFIAATESAAHRLYKEALVRGVRRRRRPHQSVQRRRSGRDHPRVYCCPRALAHAEPLATRDRRRGADGGCGCRCRASGPSRPRRARPGRSRRCRCTPASPSAASRPSVRRQHRGRAGRRCPRAPQLGSGRVGSGRAASHDPPRARAGARSPRPAWPWHAEAAAAAW